VAVFGRKGIGMYIVNVVDDFLVSADQFNPVVLDSGGQLDGDPAAAYIESQFDTLMACSRSTPSGRFYCATDAGHSSHPHLFALDTQHMAGAPNQTFPVGSYPALANVGSLVYILGRGTDNQMYYAVYDRTQGSWGNFQLVPGSPGDLIGSVAASRYKVDGRNNAIIACGQRNLDKDYYCSTYSPDFGWSSWGQFFFSSTFPKPGSPAIATNGSSEFLLGVYIRQVGRVSTTDLGLFRFDGFSWSSADLGAFYIGKPAVYSSGFDAIVVVKGIFDNNFYYSRFAGSWSAFTQL